MEGEIGVQSVVGSRVHFLVYCSLRKTVWLFREQLSARFQLFEPWSSMTIIPLGESLCHHILDWRMQAVCASTGPEALQNLRTAAREGKPYDVALLDLQMPEMDGLALARASGRMSCWPRTRLVALISLGQPCNTEELTLAGIDAYLMKPVKQARLFDCLVNTMSKAPSENARENRIASVAPPDPSQAGPHRGEKRILLAEDNSTQSARLPRPAAKTRLRCRYCGERLGGPRGASSQFRTI